MTDCYYRRVEPDSDQQVFDSTDLTGSNWDPSIQHGSPPLALLTKAIEELAAGSGQRIGRLTLDILGPIPVDRVRVRAWVDRPGRRISLCVAQMSAAGSDGTVRPVARVTAWLLAISDTSDVFSDRYPALVEQPATPMPEMFAGVPGYLETIDWRPQPTQRGLPALWWASPTVAVVDNEETTPLQNLAEIVDSANGVGSVLDHTKFVYMNTDTVVHLHRLPSGKDFALRARASIGPDGIGVTTAELFDRAGFIGTCAQTLLVQRR